MTTYYIYENHLGGGVWWSEHESSYDDLYCETCGDSDWPLGTFETAQDLKEIVIDRYGEEYADEVVKEFNGEVADE